MLSEEERERGARPNDLPVFAVYADESGKTQDHLVIGSLWLLHGPESLRLTRELLEWKHGSGFAGELHFGDLNFGNLRTYQDATAVVLRNASALSFKAAYIGRRGAGAIQGAIGRLFYYLLAGGIDHEHSSGRGQLPRALQVWKDEEEEGYDRLLLADIADRLVARFGDQLTVDLMEAVPSQGNMLIQIADLFTGSVNRVVNTPARGTATTSAKDQFARYMLGAVGWNPQGVEGVDIAVTVSI